MGLLNPRNLVYLASLAVLVAIYLRARAKPTLEVSSLMLFEELSAPMASSRVLRTDLLFWLEAAALGALAMALAGLYVLRPPPPAHHARRAFVFDLGAGMSARDGRTTRIEEARRAALDLVNSARPGDSFSVIGYALEAAVRQAPSAHQAAVRRTIEALQPMALPARAAALRTALMEARGAAEIDVFADRPATGDALSAAGPGVRVHFHQVGAPQGNLAIIALESGAVGSSQGHLIVRNLSEQARLCELTVDLDSKEVLHITTVLDPRGQSVVPFGPLKHGGVVHAHILTPDPLAADNERWAYASNDKPDKVLVLSPDPDVRDDLARVLLAVNQNLIVTTADPAKFRLAGTPRYRLAVIHDAYDPGIDAAARLVIYPQPWLEHSPPPAGQLPVVGSVAMAEMQERGADQTLGQPLLLSPARILALPSWMSVVARGTDAASSASFALAAFGYDARGATGLLAFNVRDHLLLDPDKLEALVLTIDMVKRLLAPQELQIVSTGDAVSVPASASATIIAPDGSAHTVRADAIGRVHLRPLEAGRYEIVSSAGRSVVYANYFDAAESDISAAASARPARPSAPARPTTKAESAGTMHVAPLAPWLIALALAAMLVESALLARKAMRWRVRNV
ncbi:MAG TPA: VWA domain-containing protein [Candidatus Binataceae bacterium]|nr:VWA domain-containing protein [Candidatus Binataceae bacterium]